MLPSVSITPGTKGITGRRVMARIKVNMVRKLSSVSGEDLRLEIRMWMILEKNLSRVVRVAILKGFPGIGAVKEEVCLRCLGTLCCRERIVPVEKLIGTGALKPKLVAEVLQRGGCPEAFDARVRNPFDLAELDSSSKTGRGKASQASECRSGVCVRNEGIEQFRFGKGKRDLI